VIAEARHNRDTLMAERAHGYSVRAATDEDVDALVHHRASMFRDMGFALDARVDPHAFRRWLLDGLQSQAYWAWVVTDATGDIVAGGGVALLPWPPGPQGSGGPLPFVYNVYTEPAHRRRGLARLLMQTIHAWCRQQGYQRIGLAASAEGLPLYQSMGYRPPAEPHLFLRL
jgi:GNAT superfamily N-acetyltransferase